MALNVGLEVSFDNIQDQKEIREMTGDVHNTKIYIIRDEAFR
jgi:hypothetical protein